jgi:hypothetical protein
MILVRALITGVIGIIIAALLLAACEDGSSQPVQDHGVSVDIDTDRSKPRQKPRQNSPKVKTRR